MKPTFTKQTIYKRVFDINWWQTSWQKNDGQLTKKRATVTHQFYDVSYLAVPAGDVCDPLALRSLRLRAAFGWASFDEHSFICIEFRSTGPRPHINPLHPKPSFITLLLVKNANSKHKKCGKSVDQKKYANFWCHFNFSSFPPCSHGKHTPRSGGRG